MFPLSTLLTRFVQKGKMTVVDAAGVTHIFGGVAPGPVVAMTLSDPALYKNCSSTPNWAQARPIWMER